MLASVDLLGLFALAVKIRSEGIVGIDLARWERKRFSPRGLSLLNQCICGRRVNVYYLAQPLWALLAEVSMYIPLGIKGP